MEATIWCIWKARNDLLFKKNGRKETTQVPFSATYKYMSNERGARLGEQPKCLEPEVQNTSINLSKLDRRMIAEGPNLYTYAVWKPPFFLFGGSRSKAGFEVFVNWINDNQKLQVLFEATSNADSSG